MVALGLVLLALDVMLVTGLGYTLLNNMRETTSALLLGVLVSAGCLGASVALLARHQRQWQAEENETNEPREGARA